MPKTVAESKPSPDTQAGRLQIWALGALLHDLDPRSAARSSYIGTFDDRAAADAHNGVLFDERDQTLRTLWAESEDAFAGETDKGEGAKTLLSIEVGVDKLAGRIIDDFRLREQSFRVADLQNAVPRGPWKTIAELLSKMSSLAKPSSGVGPLVVTGALAARLQLIHAGVDIKLAKELLAGRTDRARLVHGPTRLAERRRVPEATDGLRRQLRRRHACRHRERF